MCVPCSAGTYSASAANVCVSCHSTQHSNSGSTAKTDCKCNVGYIGVDGVATCTICAVGKYKNGNNPGVCTLCPVDTYNSIAGLSGSTSCMPCPERSSTTGGGNTGSDACKCDEGTFVNSGGGSQWVCNQCKAGTYSDQPNSQQCDNCPFDTYQDDIGATREQDCHNCLANSNAGIASDSPDKCMCNMGYSGVAGQTCTVCSRGKYSDSQTENNAACKPCGNGKITTNTGTTAASGCVTCEP